MDMDKIADFYQAENLGIELVGGKGLNLSKMISNDITVPPGFILLSSVYKEFIIGNGIKDKIDSFILEQNSSINHDNTEVALKNIQQAMVHAGFTLDMEQKIKTRFDSFDAPVHLAVRSSATAEDLDDASFAGQQESYLNITTYESLMFHIKCCFASLWGLRAYEYRKSQNYNQTDVSIAVIVQKMVNSEVSGVMFTANPVSGKEEIIIDASYGLGEAIVSGQVTPDNYILNIDGEMKTYHLGSKEVSIIYSDDGTKKVLVDENHRKTRCLENPDLEELWKQASQIVKLYHAPMDIEWAKEKGAFYILQARKITTIDKIPRNKADGKKYAFGKREKLYLNNMIEHLPVLWYPLDDQIAMILQNIKYDLLKEIGLSISNPLKMDDDGLVEVGRVGIKLGIKLLKFPMVYQAYKNNNQNLKLGIGQLKACEKQIKGMAKEIKTFHETMTMTSGQILSSMNQLISLHQQISLVRFRYFLFPGIILGRKLDRIVKKINPEYTQYDLLSNLDYMTATMNKELAVLSKQIHSNPDLVNAIEKNISLNDFKHSYTEEYSLVNQFLTTYGWKSSNCCIPFSSKSWNEDRKRLLDLLILSDGGPGHGEMEDAKYDVIINHIAKNYKDARCKRLLNDTKFYRNFHVLREKSQYLWETAFGLMRSLVKIVCFKLNMNYEDILYLKIDELKQLLLQNDLSGEFLTLIDSRKSKRMDAENEWDNMIFSAFSNKRNDKFTGVSGSGGIVRGRVCIVKNHSQFGKLVKGDILVCPYTDPEWTPLFKIAKGVVADTGGALSHAAIVAREYRIPAVLGVGNASLHLKDGDVIILDGDRGLVEKVM